MTRKNKNSESSSPESHPQAPQNMTKDNSQVPGQTADQDHSTSGNYFDRIDWIAFWATLLASLLAYLWTIAPNVTLEDSGELAVASAYAGVPHPPGYPIWTIYSWLFTKLFPFSNIAFRVGLSSAVAGVMTSSMLALMVSRGSRRLLRGTTFISDLPKGQEGWIRLMSGIVAGLMLTFNSVMWSQSVIVEVYTFSVCFFVASLLFLFRWTHTPEKNRYLYLCFLMFGVAVTSHQTLICAAMGIEVVIAVVRPALGRIFFSANGLIYLLLAGMKAVSRDSLATLDNNVTYWLFTLIGLVSIVIAFLMFLSNSEVDDKGRPKTIQPRDILLQLIPLTVCGVLFLLTHLTYFFMPITSMTNPPMNWGYPRTEQGFWHAITRGQYDRINPTDDWGRFFDQIGMVLQGAAEEFSIPLLLLSLLPFVLFPFFRQREKGWWIGMIITFGGVFLILLALLNPDTDAQSKTQTRVFFIPAHSILAMGLGCSLALVSGIIMQAYRKHHDYMIIGGFVFLFLAFFNLVLIYSRYNYALPRVAYIILFIGAAVALGLIAKMPWRREGKPSPVQDSRLVKGALILFGASMPLFSLVAHWSDSEQRGHLFGYWFGHDMFTPPFGLYEEMADDAILFGGTDPGRFCPTYMIFCESFIPDSKKHDPEFNRRDVYLITQNALADYTYLDYLRAHYNRSQQRDPYFFQEFLRSESESTKNIKTNFLAKAVLPVDKFFTGFGERIESKRRLKGVYPKKEIYIPNVNDLYHVSTNYTSKVRRKFREQGIMEDPFENGLITGVEHVMGLNGELSRLIFDQNPNHEFYLEESFPLEWMNPHLSPYGIIFKLNREPVESITGDMIETNQKFWMEYSKRLIGDWVKPETTIDEVCNFAVAFLSERDVSSYPVDPKYFRDSQAQKSFSKLRGAQARLFAWRYRDARANGKPAEEQERLFAAAEFAYKQSFCYYPGSPEAVQGLSSLLYENGRLEEAQKITRTALVIDPKNTNFQYLDAVFHQPNSAVDSVFSQMQSIFAADPLNATNTINLIDAFWARGDTNAAFQVIDNVALNENIGKPLLTRLAEKVAKVPDLGRLKAILQVMTMRFPDNPEAFYDLASLEAFLGEIEESITHLETSLTLNNERLKSNPEAKDLRSTLETDARFSEARKNPEFPERIGPLLK